MYGEDKNTEISKGKAATTYSSIGLDDEQVYDGDDLKKCI